MGAHRSQDLRSPSPIMAPDQSHLKIFLINISHCDRLTLNILKRIDFLIFNPTHELKNRMITYKNTGNKL